MKAVRFSLACLTVRGDELFELADAELCAPGAVHSAVELTLLPEHRRGHGAMYDGLNQGRIHSGRLRSLLAGLPLPRLPDGRLVLAVDASPLAAVRRAVFAGAAAHRTVEERMITISNRTSGWFDSPITRTRVCVPVATAPPGP